MNEEISKRRMFAGWCSRDGYPRRATAVQPPNGADVSVPVAPHLYQSLEGTDLPRRFGNHTLVQARDVPGDWGTPVRRATPDSYPASLGSNRISTNDFVILRRRPELRRSQLTNAPIQHPSVQDSGFVDPQLSRQVDGPFSGTLVDADLGDRHLRPTQPRDTRLPGVSVSQYEKAQLRCVRTSRGHPALARRFRSASDLFLDDMGYQGVLGHETVSAEDVQRLYCTDARVVDYGPRVSPTEFFGEAAHEHDIGIRRRATEEVSSATASTRLREALDGLNASMERAGLDPRIVEQNANFRAAREAIVRAERLTQQAELAAFRVSPETNNSGSAAPSIHMRHPIAERSSNPLPNGSSILHQAPRPITVHAKVPQDVLSMERMRAIPQTAPDRLWSDPSSPYDAYADFKTYDMSPIGLDENYTARECLDWIHSKSLGTQRSGGSVPLAVPVSSDRVICGSGSKRGIAVNQQADGVHSNTFTAPKGVRPPVFGTGGTRNFPGSVREPRDLRLQPNPDTDASPASQQRPKVILHSSMPIVPSLGYETVSRAPSVEGPSSVSSRAFGQDQGPRSEEEQLADRLILDESHTDTQATDRSFGSTTVRARPRVRDYATRRRRAKEMAAQRRALEKGPGVANNGVSKTLLSPASSGANSGTTSEDVSAASLGSEVTRFKSLAVVSENPGASSSTAELDCTAPSLNAQERAESRPSQSEVRNNGLSGGRALANPFSCPIGWSGSGDDNNTSSGADTKDPNTESLPGAKKKWPSETRTPTPKKKSRCGRRPIYQTQEERDAVRQTRNRVAASKHRARSKVYDQRLQMTINSLWKENTDLEKWISSLQTYGVLTDPPLYPECAQGDDGKEFIVQP